MPIEGKDMTMLAGIAAGSFIAGGLVSYYLLPKNNAGPFHSSTAAVHKSIDEHSLNSLDKYILEHSLREPAVLKELRDYTSKNVDKSSMMTDPIQAQLFRLLLNILDAKKCIEVGTYTGYNTLNVALTLPPGGIVYALDISETYVNHGRPFFQKAMVDDKIDICIGPAAESMDQLIREKQSGTFDFIYVDADKSNYHNYFEKALELLRSGGVIAFDNMLQGGWVTDLTQEMPPNRRQAAEAIHKLNQRIKLDNRVQISFLKIADGVMLCRKI